VKRIAKAASYTNLKEFKPNPGRPEDNKCLFYDWLKDLEIVFSNEPQLMNVIRTPEIRANGISITTNTVIYSILLRYLSNNALLRQWGVAGMLCSRRRMYVIWHSFLRESPSKKNHLVFYFIRIRMAAVLILVAIICNDSLTVSEFYCFHILI
jgi:hypothetical protein